MTAPGLGARLTDAMSRLGPLCVGIDPHPQLLARWGLADDPEGLRAFSLGVVDALGGHVAALKPQSAFFERMGARGVAVLEEVLAAAREAGTLTILDVKRGDIGSTMAGYAQAYLANGAPLAADAITLSPYLGFGSLEPALRLAGEQGRGAFVLAVTSNPEAAGVQLARGSDGRPVAAGIIAGAAAWNEEHHPGGPGSVGLVIGATQAGLLAQAEVDLTHFDAPVLLPGVGAQGGDLGHVLAVTGLAPGLALASSSRQVLGAGPDPASLRAAAAAAIR